jgi:hypothetical protein
MIQGIILNAFAIAMGFVVYRVITKMLMGGNGIETFASAGGSVYYDQSSCDYIQNTYGQTCSEYCESNYGEGAWSNCLGDVNCGSSDVGSCNEGMATQNGSYLPEIQTLSNDIATIPAQPSERMLPNKFAHGV